MAQLKYLQLKGEICYVARDPTRCKELLKENVWRNQQMGCSVTSTWYEPRVWTRGHPQMCW